MALETTGLGRGTEVDVVLAASKAFGLGVVIEGSRKGIRAGVEGYSEDDTK